MQNFQLLDEIRTNDKVLTGIVDYVNSKYVTFYDFSMNSDPNAIKVLLIWRSYYSHIRFSIFKELYFRNLDMGFPIMINKKTIISGIPGLTQKPSRKVERVLPKNIVFVDFVENCDDHECV